MKIKKKIDKKDLTVITTHINADFDALASMLAAQKLYPDSLIVFPGSQERTVRSFFIKSMVYLFNMAEIENIDLSNIKKLILVDTRQPGRIGKFSSIIKNPDIKIDIYDHHPDMQDDIKGHKEYIKSTGATVTILTEILKEKNIDISPDEATVMCLGIYEDTGSFTFSSTLENDFSAAGYLLSKGADLNIISHLISREISPQQVGLLNEMIQTATHYNINSVDVVISIVSTEKYVPDFASLVHKMVKMESLNAFFVIVRMEDRLYIIARSRIPEVDAGAIVASFGGGGHPFAAAATIKGKTLAQVENQLLDVLHKRIVGFGPHVKELMSSPPITIRPDISCKDANDLLTRYNINALLVTIKPDNQACPEKLYGFISRQVIEKALHHKLASVPVKEYMTTEFVTIGLDADLAEIQDKILENKQRILPVYDNENIIGVVTRTDLLNILVSQSQNISSDSRDKFRKNVNVRTKNIENFMRERLSRDILDILQTLGKVGDETGCAVYVVGGFVRDLFLYRAGEDTDIVIEGDGIAFAKKIAGLKGAHIHAHEKFGTAVIIFPDGFKIDVASARMEYYKFPAALPIVEMSSIKLDLSRRDFTINTLAIQLNPDRFGTLIDFFFAQKDIKDKAIRILHNLSFVEDPTRVFRAIRFEQRFGFSIGKLTSNLINNAVKMDFFKRLSGKRVFTELRQILEEENPIPAIKRLYDYNLLSVIHHSIKPDKKLVFLLDSVRNVLAWYDLLFLEESYKRWTVYFAALVRSCDRKTSDEICMRLELAPKNRKIFSVDRFEADRCILWLEKNRSVLNSDLYKTLSGFKTELILYMMASTQNEQIKKLISYYFTKLRYITTSITGKSLIKMGLSPGPIFREILQAVFNAKLNGTVKTENDEIVFVSNYVS